MNQKPTRVTGPTLDVLSELLATETKVWGLELVRKTGLKTGTVYPILARLETLGWIRSSWEQNPDHKGPRRRLWELTKSGRTQAAEVVAEKSKKNTQNLAIRNPLLSPKVNR
jgi:DNA-binding PadR family transcriptional regulator